VFVCVDTKLYLRSYSHFEAAHGVGLTSPCHKYLGNIPVTRADILSADIVLFFYDKLKEETTYYYYYYYYYYNRQKTTRDGEYFSYFDR